MKYLLGGKILDFKMSVRKSIDVDTQYDFNITKKIYEKNNNIKPYWGLGYVGLPIFVNLSKF